MADDEFRKRRCRGQLVVHRCGFWDQSDLSPGWGRADNMLTRKVGRFTTKPARVTANPAGGEHVVLIAVPRKPQQQSPDFSCFEQETLTRARGGSEENATLDSPLGKLLQNAMFGHGGMRGLDTADTAESQLLMQSWRVLPDSSP